MPDSINPPNGEDDDNDNTTVYAGKNGAELINAALEATENLGDDAETVVVDRASLLGAEANKAIAAIPLVVKKPITDWGARRGERRVVNLAGTTPVAFSRSAPTNPVASETASSKPDGDLPVAKSSESVTTPRTPRKKRRMDRGTELAAAALGVSLIFAVTAIATRDRRIHTQPATGLTAVPTQSIAPVSTLDIDAGAPQDAGPDAKDSKTVTPSTLKQ